jgi:hypothetical protein
VQWATAARRARVDAGELPPPSTIPLPPGKLALVVAGTFLLFAWAPRMMWESHDVWATGFAVGAMLMLALWSFVRLRGKSAAEVGPALGRHMNLFGLVILAIFNLRADVWVAQAYGVTVAEAHDLQPIWIIPILTLALIAWTAFIITLTKPKAEV